jgi:hypothetical protein
MQKEKRKIKLFLLQALEAYLAEIGPHIAWTIYS